MTLSPTDDVRAIVTPLPGYIWQPGMPVKKLTDDGTQDTPEPFK